MHNRIIANVKWYSEETDEGWIDSETADHIFPDGCWEQLGYDSLDEYTNSYGMVFTYIKKDYETPCHRDVGRSRPAKVSRSYNNIPPRFMMTTITPEIIGMLEAQQSHNNAVLHLSEADSEIFVEAMIKPPEPSENLKRLLSIHVNRDRSLTYDEWGQVMKEMGIAW